MLEALPPEQRSAFQHQHAALREEARAAGVEIPAVGQAAAQHAQPAEPAAAAAPAAKAAEQGREAPAAPAQPPSPWQSLAQKLGVRAQVEEAGSGEYVFHFGAADGETGGLRCTHRAPG